MTQPDMTQSDTRMRQPTPLSSIDVWIFDLDNTLYQAASNLFSQIDQRMTEFIGEQFDLQSRRGAAPSEAVFPRLWHDAARA